MEALVWYDTPNLKANCFNGVYSMPEHIRKGLFNSLLPSRDIEKLFNIINEKPILNVTGSLYSLSPDLRGEKLMFSAETPIQIFLVGKMHKLALTPAVKRFFPVRENL